MEKKYPYKDIGGRLRELRGEILQKDFAKWLGMPQSQYNRYETGKNKPPLRILEKVATKKKISIDWILTGEKETPISKPEIPFTLNLDFMKEVIEAVEEVFEEEKLHLPPKKKATLITLLYELFIKEGAQLKDKERKAFLKDNVIKFSQLAA